MLAKCNSSLNPVVVLRWYSGYLGNGLMVKVMVWVSFGVVV